MTYAKQIIQAMANGNHTFAELQAATGIKPETLRASIADLRRSGYIKTAPKTYMATEKAAKEEIRIQWPDRSEYMRARVREKKPKPEKPRKPDRSETMVSKTIKSTANSVFSLSQFQGAGA